MTFHKNKIVLKSHIKITSMAPRINIKDKIEDGVELDLSLCDLQEVPVREIVCKSCKLISSLIRPFFS